MVNVYRHLTTTKLQRLYNREMRLVEKYRKSHYFSIKQIHLKEAEIMAQELDARSKPL